MLYKLELNDTEFGVSDNPYQWVKTTLITVARNRRYGHSKEFWKNEVVQWAQNDLGQMSHTWNLFDRIDAPDSRAFGQGHRVRFFFLFESKSLCVLAKLRWMGRMVELPHDSINDYLENGESV